MYLRTTRRTNRDGSVATYYQLAHNVRDPKKRTVQAEVVHNFGRAEDLDHETLVRLCRSIGRVCGLDVRDRFGEHEAVEGAGLPEDVRYVGSVEYGGALVAETFWESLGIGRALRNAAGLSGKMERYERALLAMCANRLCTDPQSKLGVWDRWLETVYLPSCGGLKLAQMYEAMDLLHAHAAQVEESVFFETADLLNLEVDLVFYDSTTCSFSIDQEDEDDEGEEGLRRFGHAKEGTWAPQVVVALAVTRQGLPVRSWVFPGNTADVTTVAQVKKDLRGWKLGRALFVADSGMNSKENREELLRGVGRYLLCSRAGSDKEVRQQVLTRPGRYRKLADNLRVKEVVVGKGEMRRRYIVCFNPQQAKRERLHREQVVKELEEELASHPSLVANAKWAADLRASGRYGRYVKVESGNHLALNRAALRNAEKMDGRWVLITNDDTLSVDDAAQGYRSLEVIERCFRSLKRTQIRMTPMYHWLPRRIEAHVKICVLALLIQRVAELKTGRPWTQLRRTLARLQVAEYQTAVHRFFQTNEVTPEAADALKKLGISTPKRLLSVENLPG